MDAAPLTPNEFGTETGVIHSTSGNPTQEKIYLQTKQVNGGVTDSKAADYGLVRDIVATINNHPEIDLSSSLPLAVDGVSGAKVIV